MKMKFIVVITLFLFPSVGVHAAELQELPFPLKIENKCYSVQITKQIPDKIQIENRENRKIVFVDLLKLDKEPLDVKLYDKHIILYSALERNLESITAINCDTGERVHEVSGRKLSFSPDNKWAVLESFYPLHPTDIQIWPSVTLFRLDDVHETETSIFPVGGYGKVQETDRVKKWFFASPILWKEDSKAFCTILRNTFWDSIEGTELYLFKAKIDKKGKTKVTAEKIDLGKLNQPSPRRVIHPWDDIVSLHVVGKQLELEFSGRAYGKLDVKTYFPFRWKVK